MDLSLNKNEKENTQENIQVLSETKKKKTQKTCPNSSYNCVTRKRRTAQTTSQQEIDKTDAELLDDLEKELQGEAAKKPDDTQVMHQQPISTPNTLSGINYNLWGGHNNFR